MCRMSYLSTEDFTRSRSFLPVSVRFETETPPKGVSDFSSSSRNNFGEETPSSEKLHVEFLQVICTRDMMQNHSRISTHSFVPSTGLSLGIAIETFRAIAMFHLKRLSFKAQNASSSGFGKVRLEQTGCSHLPQPQKKSSTVRNWYWSTLCCTILE